MRALKCILFYSFIMTISTASAKKQTLVMSVLIKSQYGSQSTQVYKEGVNWFCKTDLVPYHFSKGQPFSKSALNDLTLSVEKKSKDQNCRDQVWIEVGTGRKFSGCAENPPFSRIIKELNKNCGRN